MAYGTLEFFSDCLKRNVNFRFVLPNENNINENMKLLILLHGYNGSNMDWVLNGSFLDIAAEHKLCIVMPNGENSFYLDRVATGNKYASYIGEELPNYIQKTFGAGLKKEDTFIGGFSMGGYGAIHTAFQFPDRFEKAFALSSALIMDEVISMQPGYQNDIANYEYYRDTFGEPKELEHSLNNPREQVRRANEQKIELPGLYVACGREDFMIEQNRDFVTFLKTNDISVNFVEGEGVHNFDFWNRFFYKAIEWMIN